MKATNTYYKSDRYTFKDVSPELKKSLHQILKDYIKLLTRKANLDYHQSYKYYNSLLMFIESRDRYNHIKTIFKGISSELPRKTFLKIVYDLLPIIYKVFRETGEDGKTFMQQLAKDFKFDSSFAIILDKIGEAIVYSHYDDFTNYNKINATFPYLIHLLFDHLNLSETFFISLSNFFMKSDVNDNLECFIYPPKFWEHIEELVDYSNRDMKLIGDSYKILLPILYTIRNITIDKTTWHKLKSKLSFIYCDPTNLFQNFSYVVESFQEYLDSTFIIFPLRFAFIKFLKYLEKLGNEDLQKKFVSRILFLQECPVCSKYYSLSEYSYHVTTNKNNTGLKYFPENILSSKYFVYHFLSCPTCSQKYQESRMEQHCLLCSKSLNLRNIKSVQDFGDYVDLHISLRYNSGKFLPEIVATNNPIKEFSIIFESKPYVEILQSKTKQALSIIFQNVPHSRNRYERNRLAKQLDNELNQIVIDKYILFKKRLEITKCKYTITENYKIDLSENLTCPIIPNSEIKQISSLDRNRKEKIINKKIAVLKRKLKYINKKNNNYLSRNERNKINKYKRSYLNQIKRLENQKTSYLGNLISKYHPVSWFYGSRTNNKNINENEFFEKKYGLDNSLLQ
jgi:hypothetical protein